MTGFRSNGRGRPAIDPIDLEFADRRHLDLPYSNCYHEGDDAWRRVGRSVAQTLR